MSDGVTIHKFTSVTEICKALKITRPTFYRRVEALGWEKDKREFTDLEYNELQKTLYVNNGKKSKRYTNDTKDTDVTTNIIVDYQKQISELHNLLDQQQRLSLDLQNKLNDRDKKVEQLELVTKKYIALEQQADVDSERIKRLSKDNENLKQQLDLEKNKGFWQKIFSK